MVTGVAWSLLSCFSRVVSFSRLFTSRALLPTKPTYYCYSCWNRSIREEQIEFSPCVAIGFRRAENVFQQQKSVSKRSSLPLGFPADFELRQPNPPAYSAKFPDGSVPVENGDLRTPSPGALVVWLRIALRLTSGKRNLSLPAGESVSSDPARRLVSWQISSFWRRHPPAFSAKFSTVNEYLHELRFQRNCLHLSKPGKNSQNL